MFTWIKITTKGRPDRRPTDSSMCQTITADNSRCFLSNLHIENISDTPSCFPFQNLFDCLYWSVAHKRIIVDICYNDGPFSYPHFCEIIAYFKFYLVELWKLFIKCKGTLHENTTLIMPNDDNTKINIVWGTINIKHIRFCNLTVI